MKIACQKIFSHLPIMEQEEVQGERFVVSTHSYCTQRFHTSFLQLSSPVRMWIFFTICNFLNYIDRGAFAGSLTPINEEYGLSSTEAGLLGGNTTHLFPFLIHIQIIKNKQK